MITGELESFGAGLETKPVIMVASKIDVANADKLAKLKRYCTRKKLKLYPISAVTGKGSRRPEVRGWQRRWREVRVQVSNAALQEGQVSE